MRLSEAILLGSIGTEQGYGADAIYLDFPQKCALGAALVAVGKCVYRDGRCGEGFKIIQREWPWARKVTAENPSDNTRIPKTADVEDMIWHLNDTAKWTRPQIAAWVASLEATLLDPSEAKVIEPQACASETVPVTETVSETNAVHVR